MKTIQDLEIEVSILEQQKNEIDDKILSIKKQISTLKSSKDFLDIKTNEQNRELFAYYLMENKGLSDRTVHHYYNALQNIKDLFFRVLGILIPTELYFIDDVKVFLKIVDMFKGSETIMKENTKRHYDLSAALNNYNQFLLTLKEIK